MITLKNVEIHKYKSIETDQSFEIANNITVLVGMNESGKTAILESIAKTHYFEDDPKFKFSLTHDYPRKEKKSIQKDGIIPEAVTNTYFVTEKLLKQIADDIGEKTVINNEFSKTSNYNNESTIKSIKYNYQEFIFFKTNGMGISSKALNDKLNKITSLQELETLINSYSEPLYKEKLATLKEYFNNDWKWPGHPLNEYIYRNYLHPNLPKYLYYDEYYTLSSRISIEDLQSETLESEDLKTAKALFELAEININELVNSEDFEDFKAELEATEATITEELFKYWSTNKNLEIQFDIDKREDYDQQGDKRIVEHILDIRVRNNRAKVSLPLKNRSKGFNWFFSFLVWFKKI